MTKEERIREIITEEHERSIRQLATSTAPERLAIMQDLWLVVQDAINAHLARVDRVRPFDIVPALLVAMADDFERIRVRLDAEGLMPPHG